jgi:hypothetical protein
MVHRLRTAIAIFVVIAVLASTLSLLTPATLAGPRSSSFHAAQGGSGCGTNWSNPCQVTFSETGLPAGAVWGVNVPGFGDNSSSGSGSNNVIFDLINGTYSYTADSFGGYNTLSGTGSGGFTISGGVVNPPPTIQWGTTVTFTETGLPVFDQWTVTLNGNPMTAPIGQSQIQFSGIPDGSYPFQVSSSDSSYKPSPASGTVLVNNGPYTKQITFALNTYTLTFTEVGFTFPGGAKWTVTLNAVTSQSSSTNQITFTEQNGTYNFQVTCGTPEFHPNPAQGMITINGASASQNIDFIENIYPVYFNETGLPGGTQWSVSIDGNPPHTTTTSSIEVPEFNGSYSFTVQSSTSEYRPSPANGNFGVSGQTVQVPITFIQVTYTVTFAEAGLTSAQRPWSVTFGGMLYSSPNPTIVISAANGTYPWSLTPIPGWHANISYSGSTTVNGKPVTIDVTWAQVFYHVWFNETGLPVGTNWHVTLGGTFLNSNTSSIEFTMSNNTSGYPFKVGTLAGYRASTYSGTIVVNGAPVAELITWTQVTFELQFIASGLPAGKNWSVTLTGQNITAENQSTVNPFIIFYVANGTYNFTVGTPPGYVASPSPGSVVIRNSSRNITIGIGTVSYAVYFNETGLPPGLIWAITVNGQYHSSNTSSILTNEGNGSYTYIVNGLRGYFPIPSGGSYHVNGTPVVINITFSSFNYTITFVQLGLPAGLDWSVTLDNVTQQAPDSGPLIFTEPNGSYTFSIHPLRLYYPYPGRINFTMCNAQNVTIPNGTVKICGQSVTLVQSFLHVPGAPVVFQEAGLNSGVQWSVSITGAGVFVGSGSILNTTLPNGTYSYYLGSVPGYDIPVPSGIITIVMPHPTWTNVTFVKISGPYIGPPKGFSPTEWILVGSGLGAAALIALALILRRRRAKAEQPT